MYSFFLYVGILNWVGLDNRAQLVVPTSLKSEMSCLASGNIKKKDSEYLHQINPRMSPSVIIPDMTANKNVFCYAYCYDSY